MHAARVFFLYLEHARWPVAAARISIEKSCTSACSSMLFGSCWCKLPWRLATLVFYRMVPRCRVASRNFFLEYVRQKVLKPNFPAGAPESLAILDVN